MRTGAAGSALLSQNKFSLCVQTPQSLELGDILPLFSGFFRHGSARRGTS